MRTGDAWERIGDHIRRYAASVAVRMARGILLGSRQLHRAGLINLATAKRAYALSGVVWRLGWRVIRN